MRAQVLSLPSLIYSQDLQKKEQNNLFSKKFWKTGDRYCKTSHRRGNENSFWNIWQSRLGFQESAVASGHTWLFKRIKNGRVKTEDAQALGGPAGNREPCPATSEQNSQAGITAMPWRLCVPLPSQAEPAGNQHCPKVCFITISKGYIPTNTWEHNKFEFFSQKCFVTSLRHSCHQIKNHKKNEFVVQFWPAGFFHCSYCRSLTWPGASKIFHWCSWVMCCAFCVPNLKLPEEPPSYSCRVDIGVQNRNSSVNTQKLLKGLTAL